MRSASEISHEVELLKAIKPKVKPKSMFGDDHHASIDAQIEVLEEGLGADEVNDRWPTEGDNCSEQSVNDAAYEAVKWMEGDREEGLAEEWEELVEE